MAMMETLCIRCKGKGYCGRACPILAKFKNMQPKVKTEFSGSTPPEVFVGRFGYPRVFTGILAPEEYGDTSHLGMPEQWYAEKADILKIISYRSRMIYSRFFSSIKQRQQEGRLKEVMQEVAMASKPASMEFKLKKKPKVRFSLDVYGPIIGNPAPLIRARFEENPKIEKKVDYLVSDTDVKASTASSELYKARIPISNIIKILSAGLLGIKMQRKLVPTRWAITATDSNLSGLLIDKIKYHPQLQEFRLFHADYVGNHYEILLMPGQFSFEVIEAKFPGSVWNPDGMEVFAMADSEGWHGRKTYASNVTGGYYAVRLPVAEYLNAIRRQSSVLVWRECRPEYWAPLGVGILREACRDAMSKKYEKFDNLNEALKSMQSRMKLKIETFLKNSKLVKEYGAQKKLKEYFK